MIINYFLKNDVTKFFLIFILNGSLFHLKNSSPYLIFTNIILIFFFIFYQKQNFSNSNKIILSEILNKRTIFYLFLIILPISFYFISNFNQEFPFSGDYRLHVENSLNTNEYWLSSFFYELNLKKLYLYKTKDLFLILITSKIVFLFLLLISCFYISLKNYKISLLVLTIILFFWGINDNLYLDYPAGLYFLSLPVNALAFLVDKFSLMEGLRILNFLSIFCWLLILRPYFLNKYPDLNAFLFAAILLNKAEFIYLFTSSYLEPWSLVFLLLAIEMTIQKKGTDHIFLICLCFCFKNIFIFLLPFFWVMNFPIGTSIKNYIIYSLKYCLYGMPFLHFFYITRVSKPNFRSIEPQIESFNNDNFNELFYRLSDYFNYLDILLLLFVFYIFFSQLKKKQFIQYFLFILSAAFIFLIFFTDAISSGWIGYPRFIVISVFLFFSVCFFQFDFLIKTKIKYTFIFLIIFVYFNNFSNVYKFSKLEDVDKTFIMHYGEPFYFNIKKSLSNFNYDKKKVKNFKISRPTIFIHPIQDTLKKFVFPVNLNVEYGETYQLYCECIDSDTLYLNNFMHKINVHKHSINKMPKVYKNLSVENDWAKSFLDKKTINNCLNNIKKTCSNYKVFKNKDGKIVSIISCQK